MLIIFDLDDTLIKTTESIIPPKIRKSLAPILKHSPELIEDLIRLDSMSLSSSQALKEFIEIHEFDQSIASLVHKELDTERFEDIEIACHDQANETLRALSLEHTTCLVSRGDPKRQENKIKEAGIDRSCFHEIVFCEKSKLTDYKELLKKFNYDRREALVCGDRVLYDLRPAKALGMTTVQFLQGRGKASFDYYSDVDYKIIQLVEIFDIIEEIEGKNFLRKL